MLSALLFTLAAAPQGPATLLFAGDVTLGYHYEEWVNGLAADGGTFDEAAGWGFARVAEATRAADCFVVNLECPFTSRDEKLPKNFNFRASPRLVSALSAGGVDVASLANNHLVDYGPGGVADTQAALDGVHVAWFGAGRSLAEARAPRLVTVKGVRFAFLGTFFLGDRNIEPLAVIATETSAGVAGHFDSLEQELAMLTADVRAARAKADHVIVFAHWGREGNGTPEPYQVTLAHAAVEAGASAVIGSHPHVLQGAERWRGAPIFYSLGNFVFGGNWNPKDKRTLLVELTFDAGAVRGVRLLPATTDGYPERPVQPALATGAEGEAILDRVAELSRDFTEPILTRAKKDDGRALLPDGGVERPGR